MDQDIISRLDDRPDYRPEKEELNSSISSIYDIARNIYDEYNKKFNPYKHNDIELDSALDWQKNIEPQEKLTKKDIATILKQQIISDIKITELEKQVVLLQGIKQITVPKNLQAFDHIQDSDIDELNKRLRDLQQRVTKLERPSTEHTIAKFVVPIRNIFSKIPIVKNVYIETTQSGLLLTITYNTEIISDAVRQIQPELIKLEDAFPDTYFDPRFLHINEVQEGDVRQATLIL